MREKITAIGIMLVFCCSFLSYADETGVEIAEDIKEELQLAGIIIDNRSAEKYLDQIGTFAPRYPKVQAIMPISYESGYSLYTSDGELYRFDKEGNGKIFEFLQSRNNVLSVVVDVLENKDEEFELISIKNRYVGARGKEN